MQEECDGISIQNRITRVGHETLFLCALLFAAAVAVAAAAVDGFVVDVDVCVGHITMYITHTDATHTRMCATRWSE